MTDLRPRARALLLIGVLLGLPSAGPPGFGVPQAQDDACERALAPRRAIAGMRGLDGTSVVRFAGADPADEHELHFTFVFPDRGRIELTGTLASGEPARRLLYSYGARVFAFELQEAVARELEGPGRTRTRLDLELRRALFLFPDGFLWRPVTDRRRDVELPGLGRLSVELDEEGRAQRMSSFDSEGGAVQAYDVTARRTWLGRSVPARLELREAGHLAWIEDVERLDASVYLIDDFFLPPDRRTERARAPRVTGRPLPAATERRIELVRAPWTEVVARAVELRAEAAAALAPERTLTPDLIVELDMFGHPTALVLRLAGEGPPPAGWTLRREEPGLVLADEPPPFEGLRTRFLQALPPGTLPGKWYASLNPDAPLELGAELWLSLMPDGR